MKKRAPVLMIQDVWLRWTKASRAAEDARARLAVPRMHLLPQTSFEDTVRHEVMAHEANQFAPLHRIRSIGDQAWDHDTPARPDNLRVRAIKDGFEVRLDRPWPSMLTTKWPAFLPQPLFRGEVGDTVRIDWNARFHSSLFGSNRSYFYEEHTIWITLQQDPADSTFLTLEPIKRIDLRTTIY
jgi:hypothetical protein